MEQSTQRAIIQKWYDRLHFPKQYDEEFQRILEKTALPSSLTVTEYDSECKDGKRNVLAYLYFCEETARRYRELGIPEEILMATLSDIVRWTNTWSAIKGELWLEELRWLNRHHTLRIFRIGRLQFEMARSTYDLPPEILPNGTPLIKIHIPPDGRLDENECRLAVSAARDFFSRYFPEFTYERMMCNSWLLDTTLRHYLPESSNIRRFASLFDTFWEKETCELIRYLFSWDTTKETLPAAQPTSGFSARVKQAVLDGRTFHETMGFWRE